MAELATLPKEEVMHHYLQFHELLVKVNMHVDSAKQGIGEDDDKIDPGDGRSRRGRVTAKDVWGRLY